MKSCFNTVLFKLINNAFSFVFIKDIFLRKNVKSFPQLPQNFKPVIRFAVCSDIHISGEENDRGAENLANMLDDMNALNENGYDGIDALIVAGDMTGRGLDKQYEKFVSVIREHKKDKTELLICLGNHEFIEYRDYDPKIGYEKYKKYISENVDTHNVINGYHFIGISYSDDAKTFKGKERFMHAEITKAENEAPKKPVFVFQHPAPAATIYGSVIWGDKTIKKVLKKHRNVIDFSGHSHYVPSDPRTCCQARFTALGTGSLKGLLGNPGYTQPDSESAFESAACLVAEADNSGNVRIRCYDAVSRRFFSDCERYLPDVTVKNNMIYRWNNMRKADTKPQFEADTAELIKNNDGTMSLVFDGAKGYFYAESYGIIIKNSDGKTVFDKTVVSEYTRAERLKMNVNVGKLESGAYRVIITPRSPFAKLGKKADKILKQHQTP